MQARLDPSSQRFDLATSDAELHPFMAALTSARARLLVSTLRLSLIPVTASYFPPFIATRNLRTAPPFASRRVLPPRAAASLDELSTGELDIFGRYELHRPARLASGVEYSDGNLVSLHPRRHDEAARFLESDLRKARGALPKNAVP